jgi:hypothetical protein
MWGASTSSCLQSAHSQTRRRVFHLKCFKVNLPPYNISSSDTSHIQASSTHPTMLHKRKRSENILSSPTSSLPSNNPSTVQAFYPHTKPILSPFHSDKSSSFDSDTPSHLNIRTRKRHRDNRPDADSVAASTIQRLYQAQRENAAAEPGLAPGQQRQNEQMQMQQQMVQPQKSTLHSFWRIDQPVPIVARAPRIAVVQEPRCEDCDGGLRDEGAMDVDEGSFENKACGSCRRPVCDGCAVYGRERVCAGCAGCERGW